METNNQTPGGNNIKTKIQNIYSYLTNFLKKDEEVREKSKNIVAEAVKEEDVKKIEELKEKINNI